jgi:hypothetical protein
MTPMVPPNAHMHLLFTVAVGSIAFGVTAGGVHGETITGTHGAGVGAPAAAAVAAATAGFAWLRHMPNVATFAGEICSTVATCIAPRTRGAPGRGVATNTAGTSPIEQLNAVPVQSGWAIL